MTYLLDLLDHDIFCTKRALRERAIIAFLCCSYCGGEHRDDGMGPDGRPWQLDRIYPGVLGGEYRPDNVTLSCATCNIQKKDEPGGSGTKWDCNHLAAQEWFRQWDEEIDIKRAMKKNWIAEHTSGAINDNHPN